MSILFWFILFLFSLLFAALFAFLETAFTALRLFKLKELEVSVAKYKALFTAWEKNPQRILITILIANNFAHVLTSVLVSHIMERFLGPVGLALGIALATAIILIFGEIIPKSFAKTHHEKLFASFLWLINFIFRITYPMVTVLLNISDYVFKTVGGSHILEKQDAVSEKEIEFLIDYSDEKGLMEREKTEMLQNVFSLGQTVVKEIMKPKSDIILLDVNASMEEATNVFYKSRYSRIPVYENNYDNIIGIVYQKDFFDILFQGKKKPLKELVRPVLLVPETQKINQLLSEFLKKRMHMAIIVDEYGNIEGLVTLEDVFEEIIGDEITDELETESTDIVPLERGGWLVNAGIGLEELEELLKIKFTTEDSVTLGGFLAERLQHLPRKGERVVYEKYCFQVQQASARRVFQVLIFEHKSDSETTSRENN
jgi:CBS domain containing-hemolysin-like protein